MRISAEGLLFINPRHVMRSEGYGTWFVSASVCPSVRLSVCYHVFCDCAQRNNKTTIPWVHRYTDFIFKKGYFRITTAFKSYGVKSKSTSQLKISTGLP